MKSELSSELLKLRPEEEVLNPEEPDDRLGGFLGICRTETLLLTKTSWRTLRSTVALFRTRVNRVPDRVLAVSGFPDENHRPG